MVPESVYGHGFDSKLKPGRKLAGPVSRPGVLVKRGTHADMYGEKIDYVFSIAIHNPLYAPV